MAEAGRFPDYREAGEPFDFVVVGSGFGGSVSAMRLAEKGYRVLVLERGRRFEDREFARSNWQVSKYLWLPGLRLFGILQISLLDGVMVMHGCGVGGGSLGYANVLEVPDDELFEAPAWRHLADWKRVLEPHYRTAQEMLGVATNPRLWPADHVLGRVAEALSQGETHRPTRVGVFFGPEGESVPDPYFGGEGPPRRGCIHCGACMVGCRHDAKNTLVKNYLYFAEKWGAQILPEAEVLEIRPLPAGQADGARYELLYRRSTAWLDGRRWRVRARNVVVAAGVLGTLRLLFRCRDEARTLPDLSPSLGSRVRTNSEELLGVISRDRGVDYSQGVAITSIFSPDPATRIEPVRFPSGSSLLRFLGMPLIERGGGFLWRLSRSAGEVLRHPVDFLRSHVLPGWARRTTILLVMQTEDNQLRLKPGRGAFNLFRRGLIVERDEERPPPVRIPIGHRVTREFSERIKGIPAGSIGEGLLNIPTTAHILGGCPLGRSPAEGVVGLDCQVHGYPGLYVVDGSIVPANPGVNPSLTITALAEYAMSQIPGMRGRPERRLRLGVGQPASPGRA